MLVLPRGRVVKEGLDPKRLKMPDALIKMCSNGFSGYLSLAGEDDAAVLCYEAGKIVAGLWGIGQRRLTGVAALEQMFRMIQGDDWACRLDIYRLDARLAALVHKACEGEPVFEAQAMTLLDVDRLMDYIDQHKFSGVLRLTVESQATMIFYHEGAELGFFHDTQSELSYQADIKHSIAALEGCQLDVIRFVEQSQVNQLLAGLNLEKTWLQIWRELNL
ncbi:hypothetical protein HTZ97_15615 [Desulfuromonas acetoxidans]|uniref:DUF4388 domain-containing protein n=1 Tax=Desulfuromonas acetoxidans (strain DSM 684 / 11070) TaxID=281689 RepID=Q1JXJ1_DESA6|nr:hypothetical protein [Desulfuromonas acetoxidans]EAT14971.1 conserved hypothetical protein [Desulfuromonas acetoxidans DSM 684]MBF0646104.1 hypothetical protein [Desulfuromonas acetoxidans]NVD25914.1 hypothetical protein [Desulfuromonas acetoxidans]NVE17883.1 hypothetical protein [Desulfuromonas acetoxidans]